MSAAHEPHHHRHSTKAGHKSFKSRHASKNALKNEAKGKIALVKGGRKTQNQQVMSKFDRKNHAKQKRQNAEKQRARHASVFSGRNGAPRIVAFVPLCSSIDLIECVSCLNTSLEIATPLKSASVFEIEIDRFKQKLSYLPVQRDLWPALEACKVADYVVLVLSPEEEVDSKGELILRAIESQGISTVYTVVQVLCDISAVISIYTNNISGYRWHPTDQKTCSDSGFSQVIHNTLLSRTGEALLSRQQARMPESDTVSMHNSAQGDPMERQS